MTIRSRPSAKENAPVKKQASIRESRRTKDSSFMDTEWPVMLSPPPEEELRPTRRMLNELESAPKPLQSTLRTNQSSPDGQSAKRKRNVQINTDTLSSPAKSIPQKEQVQYTPNPRLRKQLRQAEQSPTAATFSGKIAPLSHVASLAREGSQGVSETPVKSGTSKPRSGSVILQSPHATNPNANYIPPSQLAVSSVGVSVRRRSVTPIPPYEPPAERFTPPREIMSTPIAVEKKRTLTKKRAQKKVAAAVKPTQPLNVKIEPPEIDLTAPLPPASPSEDPILLVGANEPKRKSSLLIKEVDEKHADLVDFEMELNLPPNKDHSTSSPAVSAEAGPSAFDFGFEEERMHYAGNDQWTDSDDDDEAVEGEGDFTGKFYMYSVPTKMDPPTSATRNRMEQFGRPISPHPNHLSFEEEEVEMDNDTEHKKIREEQELQVSQEQEQEHPDSSMQEGNVPERSGYQDSKGRRLTLSELEAKKFGSSENVPIQIEADIPNYIPQEIPVCGSLESEEHFDSTESSLQDISADFNTSASTNEEYNDTKIVQGSNEDTINRNPSIVSEVETNVDQSTGETYHHVHKAQTEEASLENDQSFTRTIFLQPSQPDPLICSSESEEDHEIGGCIHSDVDEVVSTDNEETDGLDGSESNSDAETSDVSIVKVVSADPMAAARAAAILKMHDYDMIARKLRRKNAAEGGVMKYQDALQKSHKWRRRTIAGINAQDQLDIQVTLPELLRKAEQDLRSTPIRSRFESNSLIGTPTSILQETPFAWQDAYQSGPREWTKADWKLLDSCFTDERHDFAQAQGLPEGDLANADDIELSNVVARFVDLVGGEDVLESLGDSWSKEKLLQRAQALAKRQRSGNGAPPTPVMMSRFSRFTSPASSIIVPDFTPTPAERIRRFREPGFYPSTPSSGGVFKVPQLPSRYMSSLSRTHIPANPESGPSTPIRPGKHERTDIDQYSNEDQEDHIISTPHQWNSDDQQTPMSAVKRSLSYITSWLRQGILASKVQNPPMIGLPVPPPDVLNKSRLPVITPAKKLLPKAVPPKEQVTLHPAPALSKPSMIPRPAPPRRLVELQHIPTPLPKPVTAKFIPRRSSSASVKDLVKGYEEMEKGAIRAIPPRVAELRKMKSVDVLHVKPAWKP